MKTVFIFLFSLCCQAETLNLQSGKLIAILSVPKGSKIQEKALKNIFSTPGVLSVDAVFTPQEEKILKKMKAQHLAQSWKLALKDEKVFAALEKRIRRKSLPLNLDWNEVPLEVQSEPFEDLQWALNNRGLSQTIDLDPSQRLVVPGVSGADLNWPKQPASPLKLKKIKVAILDTGIHKFHPDLFGVIGRKDSECEALEKFLACVSEKDRKTCEGEWMSGKHPEVDLDGNSYPMDCSGWSTLGGINAANIMGRPDFDDDQGHGTHVAGIIAAEGENGVGIRGASSSVEIIPIQVIGEAPSQPLKPLSVDLNPREDVREGRAPNGLSDLVARGMIYAIHAKADVINFSLGWPAATDSDFMKSLVEEALSRGIIVVAAAGNDSTQALLRPCAYEGVICVGALGPDGGLAHFSNFGSGVEVAAPGVQILSTYPLENRPVRFRPTLGYEYLSGTSQASPYVAAAAAELLARGIPSQEVKARLMLSSAQLLPNQSLIEGASHEPGRVLPAERKPYEKFLASGRIQVEEALNLEKQILLLPLMKEAAEIRWDRRSSELVWKFRLQNLWQEFEVSRLVLSGQIQRDLESQVRPRVKSIRPVQNQENLWPAGQIRDFEAILEITDTAHPWESRIPSHLVMDLNASGVDLKLSQFKLAAEVVVPIGPETQDSEIQDFDLVGLPKTRFDLVPVDENLDQDYLKRDYFLISQQGSKFQVSLLTQKKEGGSYETLLGPNLSLTGDSQQIRVQIQVRQQLPGSSEKEYVVGFFEDLSEGDKFSPFSFFFFDGNFKLKSKFKYDSEIAPMPFSFSWMKVGAVKRPAWVGMGKAPSKKPSVISDWENPTGFERPKMRFYYLSEENELRAFEKHQGFDVVDTFAPTPQQALAGVVPILLAKNRGTSLKPSYLYDFAVAEVVDGQVQGFRLLDLFWSSKTYRNILDTRVDKTNSLDVQGPEFNGSFWFGEGLLRTQRLTVLDSESLELGDQTLKAERSQFDSALWVRAAFLGKERKGAFVLTNSEIQYHDLVSGESRSQSFERYTFFPDSFMSNVYFPLTLRDSQSPRSRLPALFTTEESALSRGVKMLVPVFAMDGRLVEVVSPARLRFVSSKGCRPLNTPVFQGSRGTAFDYYCGQKILRVPLSF